MLLRNQLGEQADANQEPASCGETMQEHGDVNDVQKHGLVLNPFWKEKLHYEKHKVDKGAEYEDLLASILVSDWIQDEASKGVANEEQHSKESYLELAEADQVPLGHPVVQGVL
jgi:hypothetical protein